VYNLGWAFNCNAKSNKIRTKFFLNSISKKYFSNCIL
jgi:hypothetical protein